MAASNGIPTTRVGEVLELVGLDTVAGQRAGRFSLGMGQRLGIAAALIGDPPVVVLDEPVNGLDPEGIRWVRSLARQLADEGRTVFISSHLMSEMALMADHLIVIGRGTILADCSMQRVHGRPRGVIRTRQGSVVDRRRGPARRPRPGRQPHRRRAAGAGLDAPAIGELIGSNGLLLHELTLVRVLARGRVHDPDG